MKLATIKAGQYVETFGYHTKGDAGAARYLVVASQVADEKGDHTLANGTVAVLQNGDIDVKQFGAKGNGTTDDTLPIQAAMNSLSEGQTLFFSTGLYIVSTLTQDKNYCLSGVSTWGINGVENGATIQSNTAGVPVLRITSDSSWNHQFIRFTANSGSTCCVQADTMFNGAQFNRCFFKGNGCATGVIIGSGIDAIFKDCYSSGFTDANYSNTSASIIIKDGLGDVATNSFVRHTTNGGNVIVDGTYLEWNSANTSIVVTDGAGSSANIVINQVRQTAVQPKSIVRQTTNASTPSITVNSYRGQAPEYLYLDDVNTGRNQPWAGEVQGDSAIFNFQPTLVPFASNSNFNVLTANATAPNVSNGKFHRTNNNTATTINGFSNTFIGKEFWIQINDSNTTIDFSASALKGNGGVDLVAKVGDSLFCVYTGTSYLCNVSIS